MSRTRWFVCTDYELNDYFWDELFCNGYIKYIYAGNEICPKTKNNHWQIFFYTPNNHTLSSVIKKLTPRHVEIMKGNIEQNADYCSKEKELWEWGTIPEQGKRHDLDFIKDVIMDGGKVDDICVDNPKMFHMYGRTLEKLESLRYNKNIRTEMTECKWYWGPSGSGKSHIAFEGYNPETHYLWSDDKGWWDSYTQQEVVILNDFRGEIKYNELLQMIDKWPFTVPRRNKQPINFTSKMVIITSSLPPKKIYRHRLEEDSLSQLLRRIDVIELKLLRSGQGNTGPDLMD